MNCQTQPGQNASLPREILSHFRWLNRIVREGDFVDKILDILDAVPVGIKQEIVVCLPEVITDTHHGKVAMNLIQRLQEGQMANVILDT